MSDPLPDLPERVSFPAEARDGVCPNCGMPGARVVYEVGRVPVHSCVLLASRREAQGFPVGDMRWAFCQRCTFLFNAAFDPGAIDYSSDYEETQGYSGTFTRWLQGVAQRLVAAHGLEGKRIVEIGCGRGGFLELVCRLAGSEGIGIDPSETAGRVDHAAGRGLRFLREPFGAQHGDLCADAIVCRHTLEHLHDAPALLRDVRAALAPGGVAFFEVPDVERQLAEGAFWDVYYEHCAYYGEDSLRAVFESSGFEVDAVERVYGDQYLQLTARAAAPAPHQDLHVGLPDSARRALWQRRVNRFSRSCEAAIGKWNAFRTRRAGDGERVVLWGSGSKATGFLTTLGWDVVPGGLELVVDINPDKWGRHVAGTGQRIAAPAELERYDPQHVIVMNPIYVDEIRADLLSLGCTPDLHPLGR